MTYTRRKTSEIKKKNENLIRYFCKRFIEISSPFLNRFELLLGTCNRFLPSAALKEGLRRRLFRFGDLSMPCDVG